MNSKERAMAVISRRKPDRMPYFGANSTVTYEQMEKVQAFWPEGHEKAETMAKQAMAAYTILGFDAVRVPFSQTFEAEALGCRIKPGTGAGGIEGIPGIDDPPPLTINDSPNLPDNFLTRGKIPELLKAVRILKEALGNEVPVVAGIIGPFTLAAHLLGMIPMLKATVRMPEKIHPFISVSEKAGTTLALALVEAGADIIACEDMAISPQLVSPKNYIDYELYYQKRQFDAIPVPKILHICGNVDSIVQWMAQTGADVLSLEPKSNIGLAREIGGKDVILMGALDVSDTLVFADTDMVKQQSEEFISKGIQILAPGCSVAPFTPLKNLIAMTQVAKAHASA